MEWRGTADRVLYSDSTGEGPTPDFNPDTLCIPRQVPPLSWDSSFLLLLACLLQCTCDLWGREEDNVPQLRTFWECLTWTEVLWAARSLAGENTPVSLASATFCQEAAELLAALMLQASSVAPGNGSEVGDFPEWPRFPIFSQSKTQESSPGIPRIQSSWLIFSPFSCSFFFFRKQLHKSFHSSCPTLLKIKSKSRLYYMWNYVCPFPTKSEKKPIF